MKTVFKLQSLVFALLLIAACGGGAPEPTATPEPTAPPTPTAEPTSEPTPVAQPESPLAVDSPLAQPAAGYADPFAYCAAVQTIDAPDADYTGPDVPESIAVGLRVEFDTPETPLSFFQDSTVWRCMDGLVYACSVGANLPCSEKADLSTEPSDAIVTYCEENPTSDFIPMVVTGRATVYQWSCADGEPQVGETISAVDAQGFLADIWYAIDEDVVREAAESEATESEATEEEATEEEATEEED
ncbi:MAG: hypothetical protein WDZ49_02480 [Litorilinea sp.]